MYESSNPYEAPISSNSIREDLRFFKAWLLFFIISVVGAIIVGFVIGMFIGLVLGAIGHPELITIIAQLAGFLIGAIVSFYSFKFAVNKYIIPQIQ